MREVPLKLFQMLHLPSETCLHIPKQCPGVIFKRITKTRLIILLKPLRERGIEDIEERGVREREKIEMNLLFMMRAGPISAH